MKRRAFFRLVLGCALSAPFVRTGNAHTPYRQWKILRQRFLLVHSTRTDPVSDVIAEGVVETFDLVLPKANAMVARAPDEQRVASLMTTGQAVLSVMRAEQAADLYQRRGAFRDFEGGQLRSLVAIDDYLLVSVASFPRHHAWLVTAALVENGGELGARMPDWSDKSAEVPLHDGAAAFARGEPLEEQD
ncbi:MAG TPA: hypothetical protein VMW70_15110 [Burkholderiales bacterium]|nr:hypothetical protein [Burkholderiales bacterium]